MNKRVFLALMAGFLSLFFILNTDIIQAGTTPKLVKLPNQPSIYYISERLQAKKLILTSDAFFSYPENKWSLVQIVSPDTLNSYSDINLVKAENSPAVFYVNGQTKKLITSGEAFRANNFNWSNILTISEVDLNSYQNGEVITGKMSDYNLASSDENDQVIQTGKLLMSLNDRLASNAVMPTGVWNYVANIELANNGQSVVTVNGLNLTAAGLFMPTDINGIYLSDERATILTGSIKTSNSNVFSFRFADNELVIPVGGKKTVKVYMAVNRPGTVLGVKVADVSAIVTNAEIKGQFPLASYNHNVIDGSYLYGQVTVESVDALGGTKTVSIGAENQILAKFKFKETSDKRDIVLKKIVVTKNGNLKDGNLVNLDLVTANGVVLSTVAGIDSNKIIFDLSSKPLLIGHGKEVILTVRGDIVGGEKDNVVLVLKKMTDLILQDKDEDYNLFAQGNYPVGESQVITINEVAIDSGTVSVSFSDSGKDRDIIVGKTLVNLGRIIIKSNGLNFNVSGLNLKVDHQGQHSLTGDLILKSGQKELARYPASNFNNQFGWLDFTKEAEVVSRGQYAIDVLASIDENADNNDTYQVTVKNFNGQTHSGRELGNDWQAVGPMNRVKIAKIGVYKNSDQADDFWGVAGMQRELLGNFAIQIGAPENMVMSGITIKSNLDAINYRNGFEKVYVKVNNQVAQTLIAPTSDPLVFVFPKNIQLSKGKRYEIKFYADTAKEANGKRIQIQITNIDITGAVSATKPTVEGLSGAGQEVLLKTSKLTIEPVSLSVASLTANQKGQIIGEFIIRNESAEKINVKELYLYSAIGFDEPSYDSGFRNLRLVYLNGQKWSGIGGSVSKPVVGGNKLNGFTLKVNEEMRVRVLIDSTVLSGGKNVNLILQDVLTVGQRSNKEAEVVGDPSILGATSFTAITQ